MLGTVVAIAVALLATTYVPGAVLRVTGERRLRRLAKGKIVLTFDDGPSAVTTRPILDILDEFGARATFFVVGRRFDRHPEITELVRRRGHEIASHSQSHHYAWHRPLRSIPDTVAGCRKVAGLTDGPRRFYRPPRGKVTLWSWLAAHCCGFRVVVWTLDTRDSLPEVMPLDEVERRLRRDGGAVVLLHDLDWPHDPARVEYTLAATRRVLEVGRDLGLEICTMSELHRRAG